MSFEIIFIEPLCVITVTSIGSGDPDFGSNADTPKGSLRYIILTFGLVCLYLKWE